MNVRLENFSKSKSAHVLSEKAAIASKRGSHGYIWPKFGADSSYSMSPQLTIRQFTVLNSACSSHAVISIGERCWKYAVSFKRHSMKVPLRSPYFSNHEVRFALKWPELCSCRLLLQEKTSHWLWDPRPRHSQLCKISQQPSLQCVRRQIKDEPFFTHSLVIDVRNNNAE